MFVLKSFPMNSSPRFAAGLSAGNIIVPLFIPTYCTIGHSFLSHPSLLGSHGASSRVLPVTSQFLSSAFSTPPWLTQLLLCCTSPLSSAQDIHPSLKGWLQRLGNLSIQQTCYPQVLRPTIASHKRTWMGNCLCLPRTGQKR